MKGVYIRKPFTDEHKRNISLGKRSQSGFAGKKHTLETKHKIGIKSIGRIKTIEGRKRIAEALTGNKNPMWKGDNVSYRSLHRWVERQLGKASKCMKDLTHKSTRYHWANISHEYKRELADWIQMCPSCNAKDRRVLT